MKPIRVLLVDDHGVVRQGLRAILADDARFEVTGEAGSGADALRLVSEQPPDIVVLDLRLPDMNGVELCKRISQTSAATAVLILTAFLDPDLVRTCLQAGARGYLIKDAERLRLCDQLWDIAQGQVALDPRAASVLVDHLRGCERAPEVFRIRDFQVLRLLARGQTNKEIGVQLCLSEHTVKGYVKEIFHKLSVHSRVEAVLRAKERGLI